MRFISNLLTLTLFFVIASGLALHFQVEVPFFSTWMGCLPGDLILTKGKVTIFLPFTSAALAGGALSVMGLLFSRKN